MNRSFLRLGPFGIFRCMAVVVLAVVAGCGTAPEGDGDDIADYGAAVDVVADVTPSDASFDEGDDSGRDVEDIPDSDADDVPADSVEDAIPADAELPEYGFVPVESVASCVPSAGPCEDAAAVEGVFATYRKDRYFPSSMYDEKLDEPFDGGRFHVAATSAVTGKITQVQINSQDVTTMLVEPLMEWSHVWPEDVVAGQPVWFAFHSRNPAWDKATTGHITINTDVGVAVDADFPVASNRMPVGSVVVSDDLGRLIVHVKNDDVVDHAVERLIVNGRDVTGAGIACLPSATVAAGAAAMWEIPMCDPVEVGSAYTVVIEWADAPASVGVGRNLRPFFPIEVWPGSSDCALPGHADGFFDELAGIAADTVYYYWNGFERCGLDRAVVLGQTMPDRGDAFVLLGDDFPFDAPPEDPLPDRRSVLGFLTGDESDWAYYDETGFPKAAKKAADTTAVWRLYPDLLTYNGAMTNRHVGTFAGMADIQGIDFYNAACAPHITEFGVHPPLRGPYDYLRNARNNHMPWLTWLYSQGVGSWDGHALPHEIAVQAISVMAAGGKGLMWFMGSRSGMEGSPDTWMAMGAMNRIFRAVRPYLRTGDPTGLASSDTDTIVESIRSGDALVVPVITAKAAAPMLDEDCAYYSLGLLEEEPHWVLEDRVVDVEITVPDDFDAMDLFEVTPEGVVEITTPVLVQGRRIVIEDIPVSDAAPVHVFVLGRTAGVRADITERLAGQSEPVGIVSR